MALMTKIYYFSGTGNSLWSAKKIAKSLGTHAELHNIAALVQKDEIVIEADVLVIVFPSYAYGLPLIVRRFFKKARIKAKYTAAFVTYGSNPGGSLGALRRILKKKDSGKLYFGNIPAAENFLAIFGAPKEEKLKHRLSMQEQATEEAIRSIMEERENKVSGFYPFSAFVSMLFSLAVKIFYKSYTLGKDCKGCAVCEQICPAAAISMKNGRPVFRDKCELCQACVDVCPFRAIQFGRVKHGTGGYRHPAVGIDELGRKSFASVL